MECKITPEKIDTLRPGEVFVFGSNEGGFHGAGASGFAFKGTFRNDWRERDDFKEALASPLGSPKRQGRWAVLGVARGLMEGREGLSYGIVTIKAPGRKRSVTLQEILDQIIDLYEFALSRPDLTFLVTKIGTNLAGYSEKEIGDLFRYVSHEVDGVPRNISLPREFT